MAKKPTTYTFKTIAELQAIPLDKIDHFCHDLALWLAINKVAEGYSEEGIKVTSTRDQFGWIDDGKHDVNLNIKIKAEP